MLENSENWVVNIEWENLHIFWTTWGTSIKLSGKTWLNIKSHTKNKAYALSRIYKFGTSYNYCKNSKWKKPFQDSRFFDFGYRAKFWSQFILVVSEYQVTQTVKTWSKRMLSEISQFSILGTGQNWRLRNFESFLFFF